MNRREFLQCAAVLAAGAASVPSSWAMSHEQHGFIAARASYVNQHAPNFFTPQQRLSVAAMAEQIIPATDTPGAGDAQVGRFVELMVSDWLNEAERQFFMAGLQELETQAGGAFANLAASEQLALLEQLEAEAGDSAWFDMGNTMRIWDDSAPFVCQFKELVVFGYFLSEVGGTQNLALNPMGSFDGDIPLGDKVNYVPELPTRSVLEDM